MPAPTSSRSSLVAAVVTTAIISIVAVVFAIYSYVEVNRANERLKTTTDEYAEVVTRDQLKGDEVGKLRAMREDPNAASLGINSSMKLLDVALTQNANFAKLIGGQDATGALAAAKTSMDNAKAVAGQSAGASLTAAVNALVAANSNLKAAADNSNKNAADANKAKLAVVDSLGQQVGVLKTALEASTSEKNELFQQVQNTNKSTADSFDATAADLRKQLQGSQDQNNQANQQITDLNDKLKKQDATITQLQTKLGDKRIDPAKSIVRQADGQIISVPRTGICYINLGLGDHISPGLTFEVYDRSEGVPPAGDPGTDENLPAGKASIEVLNVNPTSSECRITRLAINAALGEGDLIANLVYDRNTKYNFVVHGDFDLDHNGNATSRDTEVVKQLITRWGGSVTDKINADTDFVVLGKEPAIPEKPADPNDAVAEKNFQDSVAAYDKYGEISAQARSYRIPILNQNRFLYLCGYYDQSKR